MGESTGPGPGARSGAGNTLESPPLELPQPGKLSEQQVRGRACVWCAVALSNATAHDLGMRSMRRLDTEFAWFPRACRSCAKANVYKALLDHTQHCEQCNDDPARCGDGQALRQTLKELRR